MTIFALIANTIQFFIAILMLTQLSSPWSDRDVFLIFVMIVVPALNLMCFLPVSEKKKDKSGFISMH